MTDQELLIRAAKAGGVVGEYVENLRVVTDCGIEHFTGIRVSHGQCWNPLHDDGDMARLEAALFIDTQWDVDRV